MKITVFGLRRDFEQREFCDVRLYEGWGDVRATALREVVDSDVVINASYCPEGARILDEVLELPRPVHVFYNLDTPVTLRHVGTLAGYRAAHDFLRGMPKSEIRKAA